MTKLTEAQMKAEALFRLEQLECQIGLNPNIRSHFEHDRVYYSFVAAGGTWPSFDTISYNPYILKKIHEFEEHTGNLVYHAIESEDTVFGTILSLLYVPPDRESLLCGRPNPHNEIASYTVNMTFLEDDGFYRDISIRGINGVMVRRN